MRRAAASKERDMAQNVGKAGLKEVHLTIPQHTTLTFTVEHRDSGGHLVDHSSSTIRMGLEDKEKRFTDLSDCVTVTPEGLLVEIPSSVSSALPVGKNKWDMMAEMANGQTVRLCYGMCQVVDTYALDGE